MTHHMSEFRKPVDVSTFGEAPWTQIVEGAHPDERYGPDLERSYEDALRTCRKQGHDFVTGFDGVTGLEVLVCDRCNAVFREDPA